MKNNELTASELYEKEFTWHDLEAFEDSFKAANIEGLIEEARQKGYFEKKRSNERRDG